MQAKILCNQYAEGIFTSYSPQKIINIGIYDLLVAFTSSISPNN